MNRTAAAVILAGAAWMGLPGEAQAQALITPTGPLALRAPSPTVLELKSDVSKVYPGRTMGGGNRILRTNPPPSSLNRRKE